MMSSPVAAQPSSVVVPFGAMFFIWIAMMRSANLFSSAAGSAPARVIQPQLISNQTASKGPDCHRIAFKTKNLTKRNRYLEDKGHRLLPRGEFDGGHGRYAYYDTVPDLGVMIELLEFDRPGSSAEAGLRDYSTCAIRLGLVSVAVAASTKSSPISSTGALCVSQPTEMRSTPEAAIAAAVAGVTRPDASVIAPPATMATALRS
jgi:hypothetical protein